MIWEKKIKVRYKLRFYVLSIFHVPVQTLIISSPVLISLLFGIQVFTATITKLQQAFTSLQHGKTIWLGVQCGYIKPQGKEST